MNRGVQINADDFGWTDGHNLAIAQAYQLGGLHRTSLLSNGPCFSQAVDLSHKLPGLRIGVHLALNELPPVLRTREVMSLIDAYGSFNESVSSLIKRWLQRTLPLEGVEEEWSLQIEKAVNAGIKINHLDSHKHVHVIPPLSDVFIKLAKKYQISKVRVPLEKLAPMGLRRGLQGAVFWFLARRFQKIARESDLNFPDRFVGVCDSGHMTRAKLKKIVQSGGSGTTEIMVHPAIVSDQVAVLQKRFKWAAVYQFEEEYRALCNKELISLLQ